MDFLHEVIDTHQKWKDTVFTGVLGPNKTLDPAELANINLCSFGQWLVSPEGAAHKALPQFKTAVAAHSVFHQRVSRAIALAKTHDRDAALRLWEVEVYNSNIKFVTALHELNKAINPSG